jgi:hypothetical protein
VFERGWEARLRDVSDNLDRRSGNEMVVGR